MKPPRGMARTAKTLVGKTIASVEINPFDPNDDRQYIDTMSCNPVIYFTDGSSLAFVVEETEISEYGVRFSFMRKL
jgi:hypothetical protein